MLAASLNASPIGPLPKKLNQQQREALHNILTVITDNLDAWEEQG